MQLLLRLSFQIPTIESFRWSVSMRHLLARQPSSNASPRHYEPHRTIALDIDDDLFILPHSPRFAQGSGHLSLS